jgi:prepilin-type N-terminal cleavage/methylation domain-containing protein/prepilin-type processing-associated H-X9-DG protein
MLRQAPARARPGLSLIELLVVLAIIALLTGLLLAAVQKAREAGARVACANNLHQVGLALHAYEADHGRLPPGGVQGPFEPAGVPEGIDHAMWPFLLPYLEQQNLTNLYRWDVPPWDAANLPAVAVRVPVLICPAAPGGHVETADDDPTWPAGARAAGTDYAPAGLSPILADRGVLAPDAPAEPALPINGRVRLSDITDGTSNTLVIAEDAGRPEAWEAGQRVADATRPGGAWASPANRIAVRASGGAAVNRTNDQEVYGFHPGGAHALFADGSVRLLRAGTDVRTLAALITRAGGETVSPDDY